MNDSTTEAEFITALVVANNVLLAQSRQAINNPEFQKCFHDALDQYRDLVLRYLREGVPNDIIQDISAPCQLITPIAND